MNVSQLLMQVLPPAIPFDASPAELVSVPTNSDGWTFLNQHLRRQILLKGLGLSTSPFTRKQLVQLQSLIPDVPANLVLSTEQKMMIIDTATHQWMFAYDVQIPELMEAYDTLLDELLEQVTYIRFAL